MKKLLIALMLSLCCALPAAAQKIDLATKVRGKLPGANLPDYVLMKRGPFMDPRAWGAIGDGTLDDTAAWQAAVAQMESSSGGNILCNGKFLLHRVALNGTNDMLHGTGKQNRQCQIVVKTDAAFVSSSPNSFRADMEITDMVFIGGVNPIDIPLVNGLHIERISGEGYTGCLTVIVGGERFKYWDIGSGHNGANGFATLCSGDKSKSLFSAQISDSNVLGLDRYSIHNMIELGDMPNFGQSWLWWGGPDANPITNSGGDVSNLVCMYSCSVGFLKLRNLAFTEIHVLNNDHMAFGGTAQPVGIDVGDMRSSVIGEYDPIWNTNNITTSMQVGCMSNSTIENSRFASGDNVSTFGLKSTCAGTTIASSLIDVYGAVLWTNTNSTPATPGSFLTNSNFASHYDTSINNAAVTGTTQQLLVKLTGAPATAVTAATTDTGGVVGIAIIGQGTANRVQIANSGQAPCIFDGATVAGHYVQISATSAGRCHDAGASVPASGQIIGRVLNTIGSAGTATVLIQLEEK